MLVLWGRSTSSNMQKVLFAGLGRHLAQSDFLAGDTLSLSDFPIGPAVHRYLRFGLEISDIPHMRAYYDR
ncbi:glutathione S-transferase [Natronocella acetinitrilica]|uniref:Glutathione S-transferase n=1 Tax=Natronocella acetinitrilica TaxID=414046 RepID=A0AAE3G7W1_9GAMM|nr:glutathione S-transferase C-terminal domain-containing protein [Natronocella acetinitrilica]MCP1677087.1 glutathione S-transferase [Natronocella acetinitrilica]